MQNQKIFNKTMNSNDLASDEALVVIEELNDLINLLKAKNFRVSSWYGEFDLSGDSGSYEMINRGLGYKKLENSVDDRNFPWFLYWEIVWIVLNNDFSAGQSVLDLGGSSSLFSYYLASKGINIITVDLQEALVDNANHVAQQMGWNLKNHVMDMREIRFDMKFDHITSLCVYEHIPMYARVEINKKVKDLLVNGGKFSITFDYRNTSGAARISSPEDVHEQFMVPSGLETRGNKVFSDNGKNYLLQPFYSRKRFWKYKVNSTLKGDFPLRDFFRVKDANDYTFGALFLEKR